MYPLQGIEIADPTAYNTAVSDTRVAEVASARAMRSTQEVNDLLYRILSATVGRSTPVTQPRPPAPAPSPRPGSTFETLA